MRLLPALKKLGYTNKDFLFDEQRKLADKRYRNHRKHGFPEAELWSLDHTIALFVYPRLLAFRDNCSGVPTFFFDTEEWEYVMDDLSGKPNNLAEKWERELDLMVTAFEIILDKTGKYDTRSEENKEIVEDGLASFGMNFGCLWS